MNPEEFEPCTFANDGDVIWHTFYFRSASPPGNYLTPCKVVVAAGYHARVVNKRYKIDRWVDIRDSFKRRTAKKDGA